MSIPTTEQLDRLSDDPAATRKERDELQVKLETIEKQCAHLHDSLKQSQLALQAAYDRGFAEANGDAADEVDASKRLTVWVRLRDAALSTDAGRGYVSRESVQGLMEEIDGVLETLKSHDAISHDCDRSGEIYCDCLDGAIKSASQALAKWKEGA